MRLIYEPVIVKAWCSAVSMNEEIAEYVGQESFGFRPSSGDYIPEVAGRVCYQSFIKPRPGGNKAYLDRILSEGHGSVLEHSSIGFIIHGVSRSLTHQLIRHKAGTAVSELSQRFVDVSDLGFVVPPFWGQSEYPEWIESVRIASKAYAKMVEDMERLIEGPVTTLDRKRIRESARSVLPECIETHITFTANLRAWRNILEQRGNIHADLEIRRLAVALLPRLAKYAPNVFKDFEAFVDEDGFESVRYQWRKV